MRFGRSRWRDLNWYDFVIAGLALVIVYPDKVVDWIGERTGREFGIRHVVYVEVAAIGLMFAVMSLSMPAYPTLPWWYPVVFVGMLGLLRFLTSVVISLFGFDD